MSDLDANSDNSPEAMQEDFASLWEDVADEYDYVTPSRGDIRQGVILSKQANEILIDIGAKQDAIVSGRDFSRLEQHEIDALKVGDTVNVYVVRADDREENLIVSINLARAYEDWLRAEELMESGEIIEIEVSGYNKGGLVCSFGQLQGFIPASQVADLGQRGRGATHLESLSRMVGQRLPVKVIEVNRRRRRLILSERAAQREWRAAQREKLLEELREGEIRKGVVSNLCDFGAFVDLGGVDGLVHISELAWERVKHPSEVLQPGDEVQVLVLRIDHEQQRIGLSLKRTQEDPWASVEERYRPGQVVEGTVTHLAKFGAFVELEPGIEGLVHVSELADGAIDDPALVVDEGQRVWVVVLSASAEQRQVSLSMRQAPEGLEPPTSKAEPPASGDSAPDESGNDASSTRDDALEAGVTG